MAQMVRYVGWYSNRMRGDRRKAEEVEGKCEQKVGEYNVIVVSLFRAKKVPPLI